MVEDLDRYKYASSKTETENPQPPHVTYVPASKIENIQAFGFTTRGQARRFGLYVLGLDIEEPCRFQRMPAKYLINDRPCKYFNQRASLSDLRCAVNPCGACDGCNDYEPLTIDGDR